MGNGCWKPWQFLLTFCFASISVRFCAIAAQPLQAADVYRFAQLIPRDGPLLLYHTLEVNVVSSASDTVPLGIQEAAEACQQMCGLKWWPFFHLLP